MLGQLIKKEILEHLMSLRFAIACVLCLIVILCSLFVRCQDYGQVLDDYHQEAAMETHRLNTLSSPWGLPWGGVNVHRRPNPLKVFVRGIEDTNGGTFRVTASGRLQPSVRGLQNTAVPLFPPIDLVAFVGLIMSLMAIVFGYDAICGEKERGTLRLMLSYSVPRHSVLIAKWIGGYATLIIPFLLTVMVGAVIVTIQPNIALDNAQWGRLAAILGLALLYIAAVYSLAIYVSVLTRRASTSVMLLLTVWVIFVLAIPNLSPHIARVWRPAANAEEVEKARKAATDQINDETEKKMKDYLQAHGIPEKWWDTIDWGDWEQMEPIYKMWLFMWPNGRDASLRILNAYEKIDQRYSASLARQVELSRWIGRASPFMCFALAATELAGAGTLENERYMDQLRAYQVTFCKYSHDECLATEKKYMATKGKRPGPWYKIQSEPIPSFYYVPPAGGDYARKVVVDGGILAGLMLVLFMLSYITFLRYDVR